LILGRSGLYNHFVSRRFGVHSWRRRSPVENPKEFESLFWLPVDERFPRRWAMPEKTVDISFPIEKEILASMDETREGFNGLFDDI
jgi:hypothetical protein